MKQVKKYVVYKLTAPNDKVYIGITCKNVEERWKGGFGYKYNKRLFNDIVFFGWGHFLKEILYYDCTFEEASTKEIELIREYKSHYVDNGYNQLTGIRQYKRPDEVKKRISQSMPNRKAVKQYDLEGNFISQYDSCRDAERATGVGAGNISAVCRGVNNTAGSYKWEYA